MGEVGKTALAEVEGTAAPNEAHEKTYQTRARRNEKKLERPWHPRN
jgi:hypothetical protein